jgi:hypothetical protein
MVRVVETLLALGVDLLARDAQGDLAVSRAVSMCHVEVVNVLLEAHARQGGGNGSVKALLECPSAQKVPLLFQVLDSLDSVAPAARLAMARCLVHKWGANVRAISIVAEREWYPLFAAAICGVHNVVAFFLDECGIDVNMTTPRTKETMLHALLKSRPTSKRDAVRLLKYLVEEKGADISLKTAEGQNAWDLAVQHKNTTYIRYLSSFEAGVPKSVGDLTMSDEWGSAEEEGKEFRVAMTVPRRGRNAARIMLKECEVQVKRATEAEAKALLEEQEGGGKSAAKGIGSGCRCGCRNGRRGGGMQGGRQRVCTADGGVAGAATASSTTGRGGRSSSSGSGLHGEPELRGGERSRRG